MDYDVYNLVLDIVESPTDDSLQRRLEEALRAKPGLVRESNPEDGNTFLHLAAQYHHIPAVELLCRHGSDPNARNHSDETSLHHLVKHNPEVGRVSEAPEDVATLQTLLKYGADIHALTSSGYSALYLAYQRSFLKCAQALIAAGSIVDFRTAVLTAHTERLEELLSQKDAPESLTRDAAGVALDALRSTLWGSLASPDWTEEEVEARRERTFQLLLANGLDPNTIVSSGAPLLALAVSGSHRCGPGVVATLIKYGADVNSVFVDESSQERTALDYATRDGRKDTIRALKSKGAKTRQQLRDG